MALRHNGLGRIVGKGGKDSHVDSTVPLPGFTTLMRGPGPPLTALIGRAHPYLDESSRPKQSADDNPVTSVRGFGHLV